MRGDEFRDEIAQVLKARYGNVHVEHKVGGKDADIFFSMRYPGGSPLKIAVEAKDWNRLHSSDITKIFAQYGPAFENKDIDSLWIVTKLPLRAEQSETAQAYGFKLRLFTLESLYNEIVDFTPYLDFLISDFRKDGLNEYYIPPRTTDGLLLHDELILPWLGDSTAPPIAIMAGYGAGKTSYAKFLAHSLAEHARDNVQAPKPILLQLGSLTRQQSIRGLINSLFSDEFSVDGYKFPIFQIMLEQGQFVVILDGFDEMKHAMRRRDILANFDNVRQFMKNTRSKFLLLGRPDPFLSIDDEAALRPTLSIGSQQVPDITSTPFSVTTLDEFTDAELDAFLTGFLKNSAAERASDFETQADADNWVRARVAEVHQRNMTEILRRPVHAKMLATLAASPDWQISASTEYDLYHHFVHEFLRRELTEKAARSSVPEEERVAFMQRIAWWLWTERKAISFAADQVPEFIIFPAKRFFEIGERDEVILREMLIGSILERRTKAELVTQKDAYSFYFPHRSYWEYLVAEYVASDLFTPRDLSMLMRGFGGQVAKFLFERTSREYIHRIFRVIQDSKEILDASFLRDLARIIQWKHEPFGEQLLSQPSSANLQLIAMAAANNDIPFHSFRNILETLRTNAGLGVQSAIVMCANMYYFLTRNDNERRNARAYVGNLNSRFFRRSLGQIGISKFLGANNRMKRTVAAGAGVPPEMCAFVNTVKSVANKAEAPYLQFEPREIVLVLNKYRTRIDKLTFSQDALPSESRIMQVSVTDFVNRWVGADDRNYYANILSNQLGELIK